MKRGQIYLVLLFGVLCATLIVTPYTDAAEVYLPDLTGTFNETIHLDIPAGTWFHFDEVRLTNGTVLEYPTRSFEERYRGGIQYEYTVPLDGIVWIIPSCDEYEIIWTPDWENLSQGYIPHRAVGSKVPVILFPDYTNYSLMNVVWENGLPYYRSDHYYPAQQIEIQVIIFPDEVIVTPPAEKEVTLEVNINKDRLTTGEEVIISGSVKDNGTPITPSSVQVELLQNGQGILVAPDVPVNPDGTYTYRWKLEPTATEPPTGPETWTARVTSKTPAEYIDKTVEKNFQVLQLWIEYGEAKIAQTGSIKSSYIFSIAADEPTGARIYVNWKGKSDGFELPEIPVKFSYTIGSITKSIIGKLIEKNDEIFADFYFSLNAGYYDIEVEIDPEQHFIGKPSTTILWKKDFGINAKKMKIVTLEFIPVDWKLETQKERTKYLEFISNQLAFIDEIYPLPDTHLKYKIVKKTLDLSALIESARARSNWLEKIGLSALSSAYLKRIVLLKMLARDRFFSNSIAVGMLPITTDMLDKDSGGFIQYYVTNKAVLVKNSSESYAFLAHEIGHAFGLRWGLDEYDSPLRTSDNGDYVEMLILKDGKLFDLTIPTARGRVEKVDREVAFGAGTLHVYCFMGTNSMISEWICDDCYLNLFQALVDPVQPCLFISGLILENNTVIPDPWYTGEAEPDMMQYGDYTVKCLDNSGSLLFNGSFGRSGNLTGFVYTIPYPLGTETVEISLGEQIIYSASATDNPPIIENIDLQEVGEKQYQVSWTSSDPDGDSVNHLLFYSHDGGETWSNVSPEITDSEYIVDLEGLPGGDACKIRIYATDGINAVNAETGFFSLASNPPISAIFAPLSNITYPEGLHTLEGLVYDVEDGVIENPTWTSSMDGALGTGSNIETILSRGTHTLTLTGVDSDGNSVESQTTVTVATHASEEETYSALIVNVEAPGEVFVGEGFTVEVTVTYEFTIPTEMSPGIYDVEAETWIAEEFETLVGEGTQTYSFELTAPEEEGAWSLEADVWYSLEDEWFQDDEGSWDAFEVSVVKNGGGGGIPGFPTLTIVFGVLLSLFILKKIQT